MTDLHNMSVPPRTVVTVQRAALTGQRYRLDLATFIAYQADPTDHEGITRRIRTDGARYLLAFLEHTDKSKVMGAPAGTAADCSVVSLSARLQWLCATALGALGLPEGLGFFVEEPGQPDDQIVPAAAAIGLLAGRSGPLYLPHRFEPSLISLGPVTLFFPVARLTPDLAAPSETAR